jgi:hypothetical protein
MVILKHGREVEIEDKYVAGNLKMFPNVFQLKEGESLPAEPAFEIGGTEKLQSEEVKVEVESDAVKKPKGKK